MMRRRFEEGREGGLMCVGDVLMCACVHVIV